MAFQLDRDREGGILGIVKELLGGALGERREAVQLVDQGRSGAFELIVGNGFGGDPPVVRLPAGNAPERMTMSLVRVMPTIFCRRAEPPEPGICPSRCSGSA